MQITPLEQKLKGEHFVIFFRQVANLCLVFTDENVHTVVRVLLSVVADHSIPDIWSNPVPLPDVQRLFSTIVQIFPDTIEKYLPIFFRKYQAGILILYKFVGFVRCVECNRSCRFVKYVPEYATADQEKFVFHTVRIFAEKPCQAQITVVRLSRCQSQIFHHLFIPFLLRSFRWVCDIHVYAFHSSFLISHRNTRVYLSRRSLDCNRTRGPQMGKPPPDEHNIFKTFLRASLMFFSPNGQHPGWRFTHDDCNIWISFEGSTLHGWSQCGLDTWGRGERSQRSKPSINFVISYRL